MDSAGMETMMRRTEVTEGIGPEHRPLRKAPEALAGMTRAELFALGLPRNVKAPLLLPKRSVNVNGLKVPVLNSLEIIERADALYAADFRASGLSEREWRFWYSRGVRFATLTKAESSNFARDVADPRKRAQLVRASDRAKAKAQQREREATARCRAAVRALAADDHRDVVRALRGRR